VANVRIEAHDPSLHGLNEGDPGYADAKSKILEKRLMDLAKSEYWLRAVRAPSLSLPFAFATSLPVFFPSLHRPSPHLCITLPCTSSFHFVSSLAAEEHHHHHHHHSSSAARIE
jgi:hypothetical protein